MNPLLHLDLLKGLNILDFSGLLPGPFSTKIFADLGAKVVNVTRAGANFLVEQNPVLNDLLNSGKSLLEIDLKNPLSIQQVKDFVKGDFDIVLEQFRPGVMDRLGLGYQDLKKENPALIYCSLTGYGQTGPLKMTAGHDINYLATTGVSDLILGSTKTPKTPSPIPLQLADLSGSLYVVIAILSAVFRRFRTREGCYIDISMAEAIHSFAILPKGDYLNSTSFDFLPGNEVYNYFQTKDGRYLSVGSLEPKFRKEFSQAVEIPEIMDRSKQNSPELVLQVREKIKTKTFAEWIELFKPLDCCVEGVLTLPEYLESKYYLERKSSDTWIPIKFLQ